MAMISETVARIVVDALAVYAGLGLAFAGLFVWSGVQRVDSEAEGTGIGFRMLILPGVAAFWPVFLQRWMRGVSEPPPEKNPHR
jgi:TRAP-type C4-dicarboxylate transport system permease small subunit